MSDWQKTRHRGVRFKENSKKRHQGKPDRYFLIRYGREGKTIQESVGWLSEGITPQYASNVRSEIVNNIRLGTGFQSLDEKRKLEKSRRDDAEERKEDERRRNTSFDVLAKRYLEWSEENKASWRDDRSRYEIHIEPVLGDMPILDISMIHLEKLKQTLKRKKKVKPGHNKERKLSQVGLSDSTINHCLVLVRQMFNRGKTWGLFHGDNPVTLTAQQDKKFLKKMDNRRVRFLSREETDLLLSALEKRSQQLHDICLLSLYAGMRVGEVFNLKWQDIDLQHEVVGIKDPKSGEGRSAYITPPLKAMLERLAESKPGKHEWVFKNTKGGKIVEVSNLFGRVVEKLKFNRDVTDRRDKVVPHTMRHTFASWLAMDGTPIITIQKLMGHSDLSMTLRYAHLSESHEREAAMRLTEKPKIRAMKISE
jgi:integrase